MLLLNHAAADGDDLRRLRLLGVIQRTDIPQHAHLGMLTHSTGVDHNHVRLKFIPGKTVSHFRQITAKLLAVRFILLAAVGIDHGQRTGSVSGYTVEYSAADVQLTLDLPVRNGLSFVLQCSSPFQGRNNPDLLLLICELYHKGYGSFNRNPV